MTRTTIMELLAAARARLDRLSPQEALDAQRKGALLVDTRSIDERRRDGLIPGSLHLPLSVLEWRVDPDSDPAFHNQHIQGFGQLIVLVCAHGYSSSLAASRLQDLGFARATDLAGGFEAWSAAGLPIARAGQDDTVPGMSDPAPS